MSEEPRPLTGGALLTAASRITVAGTGALTTILIARLLGPDGSGGFFTAQSMLVLLAAATTLGLEHGVAYYVSHGSWGARPALWRALRLVLVSGALGGLSAVLVAALAPSAFSGLSLAMVIVTAAALPFWLSFFLTSYVAVSTDRYELFVVPPAAQSALALPLALIGAATIGLEGAVIGLSASVIVVGIATPLLLGRRLPASDLDPPGQVRKAVSFGVRGYLGNALQVINQRIDIFILSAVASAAAVGHYSVAVAVTTVLWLLPNALADILFPRIAHYEGKGAAESRDMVEEKALRHVVLAVLAMSVVLAGALLLLVVPIYGEDFRPAIDVGLILLPGTALVGIANVLGSSLVGRGKPQYTLYSVAGTFPIAIALYALLIPPLGAFGAGLSSSLAYALLFAFNAAFYRHLTGRRLTRAMVPTMDEVRDLLRLLRRDRGEA